MLKLKSLEMTCMACPSQWDGVTVDGEDVYVRYRWGMLRVDLNGETVFHEGVGDGMDGCMDTSEMLRYTGMELVSE